MNIGDLTSNKHVNKHGEEVVRPRSLHIGAGGDGVEHFVNDFAAIHDANHLVPWGFEVVNLTELSDRSSEEFLFDEVGFDVEVFGLEESVEFRHLTRQLLVFLLIFFGWTKDLLKQLRRH